MRKPWPCPSPLPTFDTAIGGFPKGRCTALVGERGALKSHLAYLWLLDATSRTSHTPCEKSSKAAKESALLVSLRDDEGEALSRLQEIYLAEQTEHNLKSPEELIKNELLRIVHFRPGYIAPDEFLFRIWFHVKDFNPKRVVIASLEQLDALFPLCSVEPGFIPSILDVLADHDITTLAIGVSGENQPPTQYGLLPQSSLILSFDRMAFTPDRITLRIRRLPTAKPSGGGGTIYLDEKYRLRFEPDGVPKPNPSVAAPA